MFNSIADVWDMRHRTGLKRPFRLDEGCAGVASGHIACKCLGIPLDDQCTASDLKAHSRTFIATNASSVQHVFKSMAHQAAGSGYDYKQGRDISIGPQHRKADLIVFGPPCQPYTQQRADRHKTNCEEHPLFRSTFGTSDDSDAGSVLETVTALKPRAIVVEQVMGFSRPDPVSRKVPLADFIKSLKAVQEDDQQLYKHIHIFQMDPKPWLLVARPRIVRAVLK